MKLIGATIGVVVLSACGVAGQTTKSETKIEVKDGREITTTGCVEHAARNRYLLTSVNGGALQYVLVGKDDIGKHVGQRVEVSGKATDLGDAKVKIESKSKTEVADGADRKERSTTVESGDVSGLPLLGVKSIKKLASTCS
jgi:hypothetical protein